MLQHLLLEATTTSDNFPRLMRAGPQSALPGLDLSCANNNNTDYAALLFAHLPVKNTYDQPASRRHHHDNITLCAFAALAFIQRNKYSLRLTFSQHRHHVQNWP
jgi:hypothetical protein